MEMQAGDQESGLRYLDKRKGGANRKGGSRARGAQRREPRKKCLEKERVWNPVEKPR